jgi:hypothetical protein
MRAKLITVALAGAALLAPSTAAAAVPSFTTSAVRISETEYAWTCVIRAQGSITGLNYTCNGKRAIGNYPVATISGVSTGAPRVCWDGSFSYQNVGQPTTWVRWNGCREGEHLPS